MEVGGGSALASARGGCITKMSWSQRKYASCPAARAASWRPSLAECWCCCWGVRSMDTLTAKQAGESRKRRAADRTLSRKNLRGESTISKRPAVLRRTPYPTGNLRNKRDAKANREKGERTGNTFDFICRLRNIMRPDVCTAPSSICKFRSKGRCRRRVSIEDGGGRRN